MSNLSPLEVGARWSWWGLALDGGGGAESPEPLLPRAIISSGVPSPILSLRRGAGGLVNTRPLKTYAGYPIPHKLGLSVKPADKPVPRLTNSTYQNTMADQTDNIDLDSVIDRLLEGES